VRLSICFTVDSVEFTPGIIAGTTSLGGSESACVGLARGLRARGHDVHIFTTKIVPEALGIDQSGVQWHHTSALANWSVFKDWDVVVALRQPGFLSRVPAKLRVLWTQDLMAGKAMSDYTMGLAWAFDQIAYVSQYHQKQWEDFTPELKGLGWPTKNGHDAALAKAARESAVKNPNQIIHISRPERGLAPLLQMWPAVRKANPNAELKLCRYSSMYDAQGWGAVCAEFDGLVAQMQAEVGGIEYLGELGKPELYTAIAESAVMWYPGVPTFAETSCIAAIEAQACGTPMVASFKGALPETNPSAVLIPGDAYSEAYQEASVAAVLTMLDGCWSSTREYRETVAKGLAHVQGYTYEAIASEWEAWLLDTFRTRYETHKAAVMRRLDYEDDLVAAHVVACELNTPEAEAVRAIAGRVARGESHTADHYAKFALDPRVEIENHIPRHTHIVKQFKGCRRILDVACGNGAIAIMLSQADPERHITAVDFSEANIAAARHAAEHYGVSSQIDFVCAPVWDMVGQCPSAWLNALPAQTFDGLVCGEFLEHVVEAKPLIDALESKVRHMGRVVFTVPMGPLGQLPSRKETPYRSHVHHFRPSDLDAVFGLKDAYTLAVLPWGNITGRGEPVGNWVISYRNHGMIGARPLERVILTRPYQRLSVGLITNDTLDLRRCLDSVWALSDEIVIGNCGVDPIELEQVMQEFPRKTRQVAVGAVDSLPRGFSEARNRVLSECTGDWFLWIDTDETLCGGPSLNKYLDCTVFNGFSIAQTHLQIDRPTHADEPVRVFRRLPSIQFYGCIHEQPQMNDANGDILPTLKIDDVKIAHTGYLHDGIRRDKALRRNLPLLVRDKQMFPERELGKLLILRDFSNLALWSRVAHGGKAGPDTRDYQANVIEMFERYFIDPSNRFHALARPFYEAALRDVNGAIEIEMAVAGQPNGLGSNRAIPERVWVRTPEQLRAFLYNRVDAMLKGLEPEAPLAVEPLAKAPLEVEGVPV
jgi:2-polyprenyl-3-methyl-5-hydroxy-6-metoxy-1,4-benzoquinol methylase/glycosyltransferase involved in cell wall biosynthesis